VTLAPLIGRDADLRELDDLVASRRLVTLVGPGGVGKTRLATEWMQRQAAHFGDRARFVSLASETDDEDDVPGRVAGQVGFGSFEALRLSASAGPTLLVLDNCESAPAAARAIASALVTDGEGTRVLATSREALRIPGEHVRPLGPLAVPPRGGATTVESVAAVDLFIRLSRAAGATWPLDRATLDTIGALVRRLEGLPLAIELAAARMRALAPAELLALLDRQLDLLARPAGGGPARHRSLRAAIDTSYRLLPEDQQSLLRHMGVFPSPFDLELVRRIAAAPGTDVVDVVDQVAQLVDRSLVVADQSSQTRTRYRLYDSIRAYAAECLADAGETRAARERYVEQLTAIADALLAEALERWSPELVGSVVDRYSHLLTAIEWCLDDDPTPERAYRLFVPLYGPTHGAHAATVATLARRVRARWGGENTPLRAEALAVGATAMLLSGDLEGTLELGEEVVGDVKATSLALLVAHRALGYARAHRGDRQAGLAHLEAALDATTGQIGAFRREVQISWAAMIDDPARSPHALAVLDAVADEAIIDGEVVNHAWACVVSVHHRLVIGELEAAARDADTVLALAERALPSYFVAAGHRCKAMVLTITDGWEPAVGHWRRAVEHLVSVGDIEGLTLTMRFAASAAAVCGLDQLADELWSVAPAGQGNTVLVSPFAHAEAKLRERVRRFPSIGVEEASRLAMALLHPAPALEPAPVQDVAPDSTDAAPAGRRRGRIVRFETCELDLGRHELRRDGTVVKIEPQVFDVLVALADRQGQLVTKNELLDIVWGSRFVSESALTSRIKAARRAVGDDGQQQRVIRTVHGRGYLFVPDCDVVPASTET
jgi:predicted ATPase/DNA-binding winged helix-turn-helix (wHTH) protein